MVGAAEACTYREQARATLAGTLLARAKRFHQVDGINEIQVRERATFGPGDLIGRLDWPRPELRHFGVQDRICCAD